VLECQGEAVGWSSQSRLLDSTNKCQIRHIILVNAAKLNGFVEKVTEGSEYKGNMGAC
jgi:hypothetical protein